MTAEHVVLVNPTAGRRSPDTSSIEAALAGHGIDHEIRVVDGVDEMRRQVVAVVREQRRLVIAGGDGTVGLSAEALVMAGLASDAPPIGILPLGSGCDLLRTFGIPQDLSEAAGHLVRPGEYRVDLGHLSAEWGERIFINIAQAGVGAAAAESARRLGRRLGSVRYPLAFAARFPGFRSAAVEIDGDVTIRSNALAVIMANGQFFAGGWNVAPKALLTDGKLDLQVIDARKRQAPALVPRIIAGTHLRDRSVTRRSAGRFSIRTAVPWPVEADGDYCGTTPVDVSVIPSALSIKI
jgi:diacylglycerol kinase (ATP)